MVPSCFLGGLLNEILGRCVHTFFDVIKRKYKSQGKDNLKLNDIKLF